MKRRTLLRAMGAGAMSWPLHALLRSPARANDGRAKVLLILHTPGTDLSAWSPVGSSSDKVAFSAMTEPLAAIQEDILLFENFDSLGTAATHAAVGGLTGSNDWNALYSLEQVVADQLIALGETTPIPSLLLGGIPDHEYRSFWRPGGQSLAPIVSPAEAFDVVFAGHSAEPNGSATGGHARRKRSLALIQAELESLGARVGAREQRKLALHYQSVAAIAERIDTQGHGGTAPQACNPMSPTIASEELINNALSLDIALTAFSCGITRVAAVAFGHHQNTQISLPSVGAPGNWHNDFMHSDAVPRQRLIEVERWLCEQLVAAAAKLKQMPSPYGGDTLWDDTLILWSRDMGNAIDHAGDKMPFVISGGAGGYLKKSAGGRYIDGAGAPHLRVLMTAADAMGISELSAFGDKSLTQADRAPIAEAKL